MNEIWFHLLGNYRMPKNVSADKKGRRLLKGCTITATFSFYFRNTEMTMHLLRCLYKLQTMEECRTKVGTVVWKGDMITSKTSPMSNFNNLRQQPKLKNKYCRELNF
jgi:hypothetical protein